MKIEHEELTDVSTHSRLKAAGTKQPPLKDVYDVSTHSRLKAAGAIRLLSKSS